MIVACRQVGEGVAIIGGGNSGTQQVVVLQQFDSCPAVRGVCCINKAIVVDININLAAKLAQPVEEFELKGVGGKRAPVIRHHVQPVVAAFGSDEFRHRRGGRAQRHAFKYPLIGADAGNFGQAKRIRAAAAVAAIGHQRNIRARLNLQGVAFAFAAEAVRGGHGVAAGLAGFHDRAFLAVAPSVGEGGVGIIYGEGHRRAFTDKAAGRLADLYFRRWIHHHGKGPFHMGAA